MQFYEIIQELGRNRRAMNEVKEALEKASVIFNNGWELLELPEYYEKYWRVLDNRWYYDKDIYIRTLFKKVQDADISRNEFLEQLALIRDAIKLYINEKRSHEEELKGYIISSYDLFFAEHFTELDFLFGLDQIKQGLLEFLIANEESQKNP